MPATADSLHVTTAATVDSIAAATTAAADSVATPAPEITVCGMLLRNHEADAPTSSLASADYTVGTVPYSSGVEAIQRPDSLGVDSGVVSILVVMFLIVTFSFKHFISVYRSLFQDLYMVRKRENAFDEHTAGESTTIMALSFQTALCQAILFFAALNIKTPTAEATTFPMLAGLTAMTLALFIFQLAAFRTIAYAFTEPFLGSQWIKGLKATQALMGFLLLIPALIVLFYPAAAPAMVTLAAIIYVAMRIMLIIKGFRIFYDNFLSLIYFILYLCALEIVPLLILGVGAMKLSTFLQL